MMIMGDARRPKPACRWPIPQRVSAHFGATCRDSLAIYRMRAAWRAVVARRHYSTCDAHHYRRHRLHRHSDDCELKPQTIQSLTSQSPHNKSQTNLLKSHTTRKAFVLCAKTNDEHIPSWKWRLRRHLRRPAVPEHHDKSALDTDSKYSRHANDENN